MVIQTSVEDCQFCTANDPDKNLTSLPTEKFNTTISKRKPKSSRAFHKHSRRQAAPDSIDGSGRMIHNFAELFVSKGPPPPHSRREEGSRRKGLAGGKVHNGPSTAALVFVLSLSLLLSLSFARYLTLFIYIFRVNPAQCRGATVRGLVLVA